MYTISSMYTEILFYSRVTHICWMENNPDAQLLKVLVCLFLYLKSNKVIVLWKVSKRNKKDQKPIFLLSLLTLLEFYQHLQKQITTLQICCVTKLDETSNSTSWAKFCPKMDLGFEIQKANAEIRISILEIPCVPIFRQNRQLWLFWPQFAQQWIFDWKFRKLMLK